MKWIKLWLSLGNKNLDEVVTPTTTFTNEEIADIQHIVMGEEWQSMKRYLLSKAMGYYEQAATLKDASRAEFAQWITFLVYDLESVKLKKLEESPKSSYDL